MIVWGFCGRMIILSLRDHGFGKGDIQVSHVANCQDVFVQERRLDSKTIRHFQARGWCRLVHGLKTSFHRNMKQTFPLTFSNSKEKVASFFIELFLRNYFTIKVHHTLFAHLCPYCYHVMDSFPIRGLLVLGEIPLLKLLHILFFAIMLTPVDPSIGI